MLKVIWRRSSTRGGVALGERRKLTIHLSAAGFLWSPPSRKREHLEIRFSGSPASHARHAAENNRARVRSVSSLSVQKGGKTLFHNQTLYEKCKKQCEPIDQFYLYFIFIILIVYIIFYLKHLYYKNIKIQKTLLRWPSAFSFIMITVGRKIPLLLSRFLVVLKTILDNYLNGSVT